MASKITIKRSLTAAAPAGLSFGEMAFVQGSGNTAEQLYVGISGGNPVWVGARVENTVTDWDSKTRLATQAATLAKINSLITSNTAGVASFNGLTGAVNGITAGGINTFTQLNTFSAGISASSGVTFSKDITINSMTVGRGGNSNFYNVAVGSDVLISNAQGNYNVAVGNDALKLNTSGGENVAVGNAALSSNTTATENVAIGVSALGGATMGNSNVGVGHLVLQNNSGSLNIGVGMGALSWNYGNGNVAVGASALTTPGANDSNVAVGASTLSIVTGANNTGIGAEAGYYRGSGEDNTLTSANNAIYIGFQARASAAAQTNEIVIGAKAIGLGSNTAVIGATGQSAATIYGVLNLPKGLSASGATFTGNISAPNIVYSFNGLVGAVSGLTSGGPLGTPASGTLTNCTGLPISGLAASTSTALGVGTIELGHATDTTLARSGAGVVTIEGVEIVTLSAAQTLTSKTLTTPKIAQINDTNGNAVLKTAPTASAVNEVTITNNITGYAPHVSATGSDTNISLHLAPKGTGSYVVVENGTDGTKQIAIGVAGANTGTTTFFNAAQTVNRTITLPDATGTVALTANKLSVFAATTSSELLGVISDETGTGSLVFASSPTLVTPTLGVAAATSINKVTITTPATGSTITVADGKTLTASNTLTFTGTDASSVAFGAGGTVVYTSGLGTNVAAFLATPSSANLISAITDETGTGALVFANTPTLVTPNIGAATGTSLVLSGDLTVNGTTTNINTTNLVVEDKNIVLGDVTTPSDATADGGGITLKGLSDKTLNWVDATDAWTSSEHFNLLTGKAYYINGASVLNATTLGSAIVTSSLTSVGTITSGTWSGSFGAVSGANLTNINATNVAITSETSDTTCFITFVTNNTGDLPTKVNSSLTYNAVSGELSATLIDGGTF